MFALAGGRLDLSKAYEAVFAYPMIIIGYQNTLFYVLAGTTINLLLTSLGAYGLSRRNVLLRNPIIPAAVLLGWEAINGFLPDILQKLSVLYYLQSLCPVPAPVDESTPAILRLLLAPAEPASRLGAILGLLALTALVLWIARRAILRMEVSYGTEA